MKFTPLKVIIIILILAILAFGIYQGIKIYKQKKLAEGLIEYAKEKGKDIDEDELKKNIRRLDNRETNTLIKFALAAKEKRYLAIVSQLPAVTPILKKLNLLSVLQLK